MSLPHRRAVQFHGCASPAWCVSGPVLLSPKQPQWVSWANWTACQPCCHHTLPPNANNFFIVFSIYLTFRLLFCLFAVFVFFIVFERRMPKINLGTLTHLRLPVGQIAVPWSTLGSPHDGSPMLCLHTPDRIPFLPFLIIEHTVELTLQGICPRPRYGHQIISYHPPSGEKIVSGGTGPSAWIPSALAPNRRDDSRQSLPSPPKRPFSRCGVKACHAVILVAPVPGPCRLVYVVSV